MNLIVASMLLALAAPMPGGPAANDHAPRWSPAPAAAAAARGRRFAGQVCASCHAIDASTHSRRPGAPSFMTLRGQYNQLTLRRKLTDIIETGHYQMPPVKVDSDQVADLVAYLDSLGAP